MAIAKHKPLVFTSVQIIHTLLVFFNESLKGV